MQRYYYHCWILCCDRKQHNLYAFRMRGARLSSIPSPIDRLMPFLTIISQVFSFLSFHFSRMRMSVSISTGIITIKSAHFAMLPPHEHTDCNMRIERARMTHSFDHQRRWLIDAIDGTIKCHSTRALHCCAFWKCHNGNRDSSARTFSEKEKSTFSIKPKIHSPAIIITWMGNADDD